jgi:hypothetical protein
VAADASFRDWAVATALALAIATPSLLGLWYGWPNRGPFTGFIQPGLYAQLMAGELVAPWQTLAAVGATAAASFLVALLGRTRAEAVRTATWVAVGVVLVVLSLHLVTTGNDAIDRMLRYVLRLRTLGYAACWWMLLAAVRYGAAPRAVRWAAIALTAAGVLAGWGHYEALGLRMRQAHAGGRPYQSQSSAAYGALLNDLRDDSGTRTVTIALAYHPKPGFRHPFQRLTHVVRQPALSGHGVELSAVRNDDLVYRPTALPCVELRRQVRAYAVGYVVGHNDRSLRHVTECLGRQHTLRRRDWWAVRTGVGWHNFDARVRGFSHDATWTSLRWQLEPGPQLRRIALPMAATAPWRALTDAGPATLAPGRGRMLTVVVPPGAGEVTLEYAGFRGEWLSVGLSAAALAAAVRFSARRRACRRR